MQDKHLVDIDFDEILACGIGYECNDDYEAAFSLEGDRAKVRGVIMDFPLTFSRPKGHADKRLWDVVFNNPHLVDKKDVAIEFIEWMIDNCIYCAWALEVGEEGTPHLQCMIETRTQLNLAALNRRHYGCLTARTLISPDSDSLRNYILYRKKNKYKKGTLLGGPWEHGTYTRYIGAKGDKFCDVYRMVKENKNDEEILDQHTGLLGRYPHVAENYRTTLNAKDRDWPTALFVFCGQPGAGKTRTATLILEYAYHDFYSKPPGPSFDGYYGQQGVLWDEYDNDLPPQTLLAITDRYKCRVRKLYGQPKWSPELMFMTSNATWWQQGMWTPQLFLAIQRRVCNFMYFDNHWITLWAREVFQGLLPRGAQQLNPKPNIWSAFCACWDEIRQSIREVGWYWERDWSCDCDWMRVSYRDKPWVCPDPRYLVNKRTGLHFYWP